MIKHCAPTVLVSALSGALLFFNSGLSAQCKIKPIVKKEMPQLAPYQYDSYVVKEIVYGSTPKKETVDFEVYSEEEYKLVFCQTELPQEVGITIYGKNKGKKEILYFDESGKKTTHVFTFGSVRSGTYFIEYETPPASAPNQKGCFVVLIGIKD